jgi:hypothetical protein
VLENPNGPPSRTERASVLTAARAIGQQVIVLRATREGDFDNAFATLVHERAGALLVTGDALFTSRRDRFIALAARHAILTIHSEKLSVQAGALMTYGTNIPDAYRLVGIYAGRILKGEKPSDLPVIQSTKFELVIRRRRRSASRSRRRCWPEPMRSSSDRAWRPGLTETACPPGPVRLLLELGLPGGCDIRSASSRLEVEAGRGVPRARAGTWKEALSGV